MGGLCLNAKVNAVGLVRGRLTCKEEVSSGRKAKVLCACSCGAETTVFRVNFLAGYSQSCGCLQKQRTSKANLKHGHSRNHKSRTGTYKSWMNMWSRCRNPNRHHADRYIGKGITVCEAWFVFENFLADMGERPEGQEIDRIDNNKGYYKENCRWVTHQVNCQNRYY